MSSTKISAAKLARLACEALARREEEQEYVTIDTDGEPIRWTPEVALAVAGHVARYWPGATTRPLTVESHTPHRVLRYEQWHGTYRTHIATPDSGTVITELCGHPSCPTPAPAHAGSRCTDHFGDAPPKGHSVTYWAETALAAWAQAHPARGEEKRAHDTARNALLHAARQAGLKPMAIHHLTGMSRATIDRVLNPQPAPAWTGHPDDGPA